MEYLFAFLLGILLARAEGAVVRGRHVNNSKLFPLGKSGENSKKRGLDERLRLAEQENARLRGLLSQVLSVLDGPDASDIRATLVRS